MILFCKFNLVLVYKNCTVGRSSKSSFSKGEVDVLRLLINCLGYFSHAFEVFLSLFSHIFVAFNNTKRCCSFFKGLQSDNKARMHKAVKPKNSSVLKNCVRHLFKVKLCPFCKVPQLLS